MKKFIAIPLLFLYTMAISGMMIQLHYCGNELSSWAVNAAKAACCCEESGIADVGTRIAAEDDCCKDRTIDLKIEQDQNTAASINFTLNGVQQALPAPAVSFPFTIPLSEPEHSAYAAHAPPGLWQLIPLYKLHQRFTFYG